jgi:hypothetical protein
VTALAVIAKASGIALLMGALLGGWAWSALDEPRRSLILRQAKWLVIPGYVGVFLWAAIFGFGLFAWGCDPVFGGWTRTPLLHGSIAPEVLSCGDTPLQARGKAELRAEFPYLPNLWSQVYRDYDAAAGLTPDPAKVWIGTIDGRVYHVPKVQLEFRAVPPRRGTPWWQPEEASDAW